jgi:hypothetical protein
MGRVIQMSIKTYSELITLPTFLERYRYLRLGGLVGKETFGFDRYLNQKFYQTKEYKDFRRDIIVRDMGCDLGIEDREIQGLIIVHHINPITIDDIVNHNVKVLLDPENAICVSDITHKAIHYGNEDLLITEPIERSAFDTCPWKMKGDYYGL